MTRTPLGTRLGRAIGTTARRLGVEQPVVAIARRLLALLDPPHLTLVRAEQAGRLTSEERYAADAHDSPPFGPCAAHTVDPTVEVPGGCVCSTPRRRAQQLQYDTRRQWNAHVARVITRDLGGQQP